MLFQVRETKGSLEVCWNQCTGAFCYDCQQQSYSPDTNISKKCFCIGIKPNSEHRKPSKLKFHVYYTILCREQQNPQASQLEKPDQSKLDPCRNKIPTFRAPPWTAPLKEHLGSAKTLAVADNLIVTLPTSWAPLGQADVHRPCSRKRQKELKGSPQIEKYQLTNY